MYVCVCKREAGTVCAFFSLPTASVRRVSVEYQRVHVGLTHALDLLAWCYYTATIAVQFDILSFQYIAWLLSLLCLPCQHFCLCSWFWRLDDISIPISNASTQQINVRLPIHIRYLYQLYLYQRRSIIA